MIITWILILCPQLILAFPLLHKTEGGSLKSIREFSPLTNPFKPSTSSGKISQIKNQLAKPSVTTLYVVLHSPWPRSVTNPLQVQADSRKGAQRIRSKKELRIKTILVGFWLFSRRKFN